MNIVAPHRNISRHVNDYSEIEEKATLLRQLADGTFQGLHKECFALHHSQVDPTPFNFFVLSKLGVKQFPHWLIINPKVISRDKSTIFHVAEGCMSYPFRKTARINRFGTISVEFQIPVRRFFRGASLKTIHKDLSGLAAQIFQHEFDHSVGKYIFDA